MTKMINSDFRQCGHGFHILEFDKRVTGFAGCPHVLRWTDGRCFIKEREWLPKIRKWSWSRTRREWGCDEIGKFRRQCGVFQCWPVVKTGYIQTGLLRWELRAHLMRNMRMTSLRHDSTSRLQTYEKYNVEYIRRVRKRDYLRFLFFFFFCQATFPLASWELNLAAIFFAQQNSVDRFWLRCCLRGAVV